MPADNTRNKVIVIIGANASGKSSLAIDVARRRNGEVISADSRQVYRGLDLASGKVTEEEMQGVSHHLLDVADIAERYSAADYARDASRALCDILAREYLPIIAGGTGFYIDALLRPELLPAVPPNDELRADLAQYSPEELFAQLEALDPARAHDLRANNEHTLARRLIRAIEVAISPTAPRAVPELPELNELWVGIWWSDDELKQRIHERILARIGEGMIEEIQHIHERGVSYERLDELGLECRYIAQHLQGELTKDELIDMLNTKIWQYAKRQRTWFRRYKNIEWFHGRELAGANARVAEFLE